MEALQDTITIKKLHWLGRVVKMKEVRLSEATLWLAAEAQTCSWYKAGRRDKVRRDLTAL